MRRKLFALPHLALLALLGLAGSAQALPSVPLPATPALPTLFAIPGDEEEEDWETEAGEEEELEAEECEEDEAGECEEEGNAEEGAAAPPECLLSSADATVFAASSQDRIRLQVRYATASPTPVSIAYGLHGPKGALFLGSVKKHFGKKGVLRVNRSLSETQMVKVVAARAFTVRIRALRAPGWCQSIFDRHLTLRRPA